MLNYIILYYIILYNIILYYIILYYIISYHMILYYIIYIFIYLFIYLPHLIIISCKCCMAAAFVVLNCPQRPLLAKINGANGAQQRLTSIHQHFVWDWHLH